MREQAHMCTGNERTCPTCKRAWANMGRRTFVVVTNRNGAIVGLTLQAFDEQDAALKSGFEDEVFVFPANASTAFNVGTRKVAKRI